MATKNEKQLAVVVQQEISAGTVFLTLIAVGVLPIIVGLYAALMATVISRSTQFNPLSVVFVTDLPLRTLAENGDPMVLGSAVNGELIDDAPAGLPRAVGDEASTGVIEGVDEAPATMPFQRGDVNGDAVADVEDLSVLLDYVAYGLPIFCLDAADVNDDGRVNFLDVTYWTAWFAQGGPAPLPPGPAMVGVDPTPDALGCDAYP